MRPSYATRSLVTRVSGTTIFVLIGYSETTTVSARLVLNTRIPVQPFTCARVGNKIPVHELQFIS